MKRLVWLLLLVVVSSLFAEVARAQRETLSLKEAVQRVVEQSEEGEGDATEAAAGVDSTEAASVLDDILLSPEPYYYEGLGRRDPFTSLVANDDNDSDMDITGRGNITVVGILWGDNDKFALVETSDGVSAILREGDRFRNTVVTSVAPDGISLQVDNYGIRRTINVPLTEGALNNAGGRSER